MTSFFNFDIDKSFRKFENLRENFSENIETRMKNIEEAIRSGDLKGEWNFEKIDKPGIKGYVFRGYFVSDDPIKPFQPLEPPDPFPFKRRPTPERRLKILSNEQNEIRKPYTDVFNEKNSLKLYIELPGEKKENIQLNVTNAKAEIMTKNFFKSIDLPRSNIDLDQISAKYNNGVLEVTLPKTKEIKKKTSWNVKIE